MACSEEVEQAGLELVVVYLCEVEAQTREARRRRRKIGWDSRDWVPGFAVAPALKKGEDGSD
eukprot:SAG11_NODE_2174_length_3719_cov_4.843094_3_plen_62_part_00